MAIFMRGGKASSWKAGAALTSGQMKQSLQEAAVLVGPVLTARPPALKPLHSSPFVFISYVNFYTLTFICYMLTYICFIC